MFSYDAEWHCLLLLLFFPRMESLSAMFKTGLYINDLSMHDSSRDLVLAGTQQSEELKRALIQVRHARKSCSLFSMWSAHLSLCLQPNVVSLCRSEARLLPDHAGVKCSLFWVQEQKKSSKLEESMKMLDYEMKKTDDLLYRMIPKPVAKRLRKGEPAVNTCEVRMGTI